ncbi:MAG: YfbM family protein [Chloroflexaceae bacterium]|jgi:hypothetical protein|nr:YfbM family protein [Chloroflexaceae bacterium]
MDSVDAFLIRVPPERWPADALTNDEVVGELILSSRMTPGARLALEESWCAIHILLTWELPIPKHEALRRGMSWEDDSLENIFMGGTPTTCTGFFGPVCYMAPAEMQRLNQKLATISPAQFEASYDVDYLMEYRVPPDTWDDLPHARQWLVQHYKALQAFYQQTADRGDGLLILLQ